MTTDVGYLVRAQALNNQKDESRIRNETTLITRDLLGESFSSKIDDSQELDLDLQVPAGWEKRLDLKSGKVYLQKCSPQPSRPATKPLQENKSPTIKRPLNIMEETSSLDLKLVSSPKSPNNSACSYLSVCTLDKVKSALDRARNERIRRMFFPKSSMSPSNSSTSTKVTLELDMDEAEVEKVKATSSVSQQQGLLSAAGCSNCLMYVMISKENPKCPKCHSTVSLPVMKKPRVDLDLNISI